MAPSVFSEGRKDIHALSSLLLKNTNSFMRSTLHDLTTSQRSYFFLVLRSREIVSLSRERRQELLDNKISFPVVSKFAEISIHSVHLPVCNLWFFILGNMYVHILAHREHSVIAIYFSLICTRSSTFNKWLSHTFHCFRLS